ncbi:hypothetical protein [Dokdonia sp. Hel_I_53]|uniref:hypothetical protein n=1 Tax=Dokdonia sp. Hel_I_53 TaxID=1566287 RepID=UPI00119AE49E|nr:hypothetical protein [Dokdonia sp. Hel_I_53]TVZ52788.1 hypothetical protein OD90_1972 [Dokdonia sp. Hel_I_53]
MKKYIQAELANLAHKTLHLDNTSDYTDLAKIARELHEKLAVLAYIERLEKSKEPSISLKELEDNLIQTKQSNNNLKAQNSDVMDVNTSAIETSQNTDTQLKSDDHYRPDGTLFNDGEAVHEPVIEKIKDMWPEMSPEAADIDEVLNTIIPPEPTVGKNDSFEIGNEYKQTPIFEPKETSLESNVDEKSKSLNDSLRKGTFKIGLNDKLSFIKHLFNGNPADYNRVLSQLETFQSAKEAQQFISQMIKPDYDNWAGKEVQEERFLQIVESRYS